MKKYLFLSICTVWFAISVSAQENNDHKEAVTVKDSTAADEPNTVFHDGASYNFIFTWKKHHSDKKHRPVDAHWSGLGFAFSDLNGLNNENVVLNYGNSYSLLLNVVDFSVPLNHHWLIATGWGFDWTRFHFKGNKGLQNCDDGITRFVPDVENRAYKDSKLHVYYATIPLIFEYQAKISRHNVFFIQGGVEGLIKLYSRSQVEVQTQDGVRKIKYKGINLLPLNFRMVMRIGIAPFNIFGYYQPFSMFKKGEGPEINSFGMGIAVAMGS
ncbi:MAG: PorT family protein [Prevotellaceae bacterium]|jgi:hypothetical protein|nr:PorT family protein [Prevotellaceae bacterium]